VILVLHMIECSYIWNRNS